MKNNKLESFEEFSTKELDQLDRLNVLDEEKIIGGKKNKGGGEIGTIQGPCADTRIGDEVTIIGCV
tara:strand:- start:1234 stop:1431 length:198 start_codon:yes stop_codon:yes gene_type:complete